MDGAAAARWQRIDAALDALLDLRPEQRAAAVDRLAEGDAELHVELSALLLGLDAGPMLIDAAAAKLLGGPDRGPAKDRASLAAGTRLGAWRVAALLGRGGMGEVYRAERADGQFEQVVALKLVRADAQALAERFHRERQIVARLDHPGIARLLDGGIADDGRPFMVIEFVDGLPIVDWCARHQPALDRRLALFAEVCEAVAYAHRNLVVHRDLKPANVLVTADGRVKLLDFGIARLVDGSAGDGTRELLLTPGYAAPEQLAGAPVTTAADVYALGLLLYELLTARPAHEVSTLPLAAAMHAVIHGEPPSPSRVAALPPPLRAAALAGDLDAIVAKALRKEPEARYRSVDELSADVHRHGRQEPVLARRGTWTYVAARALRRHRAVAGVAALLLLSLIGGSGLVAWQARVARTEAERATAVKQFLLQVFAASDPRVASDRPRGQVTARELLDAASSRIDTDFAQRPDLHIELLGVVSRIYRELGETAAYQRLQQQQLALAQQRPGQFVAAEIQVALDRAGDALDVRDFARAQAQLASADRLLRTGGLDDSVLRAQWWLLQGQSLALAEGGLRKAAFDRALALFEQHAPHHAGKVTTLSELGTLQSDLGDMAGAAGWFHRALDAYATTIDRDDGEAQTIWGNLGRAQLNLGQYEAAERSLAAAAELARRTYGEHHADYWVPAATHARVVHLQGRRDEAMRLFSALRSQMPAVPADVEAWEALAAYIDCLTADGSAAEARPLAEAALRFYRSTPKTGNSVRRMQLRLGDIEAQLGDEAAADRDLGAAYAAFVIAEPVALQTRMAATERWARQLLDRGRRPDARRLFEQVLAADGGRQLAHAALAQAGLARIALADGDLAAAGAASLSAMARWVAVQGFRDVRMGAYLHRVRAEVLLAQGQLPAAAVEARAALAVSVEADAPDASSLIEARRLLRRAAAG